MGSVIHPRFIRVFNELIIKKICAVYIDDVVVLGESVEEAVENLRITLKVAEKAGLKIKWSKCQFLQERIQFLGYDIAKGTILPSADKTIAIQKFPEPRNVKEVQRFLGLTAYFRKFVYNYSLIARPLTNLLKKDAVFIFGEEERAAVQILKNELVKKPLLQIYNPEAETVVHTDASKFGYGAILLQRCNDDWKSHPVYYYSKKTTVAEMNYSSYELKVLAVVAALKKFRIYLIGINFKIITDCSAIKATMDQKEIVPKVARWAFFMQEFTGCSFEHRPGKQMAHVDALSRHPIMVIQNELVRRIEKAQDDDDNLKMIKELLKYQSYQEYEIQRDALFEVKDGNKMLVVPKNMQRTVIEAHHLQGHFSAKNMEELISRELLIPSIRKKIEQCVANCIPCILSERKRGKAEGLLNCIEKGEQPLATYHVDHLGQMTSTTKMYKHIFAVIDSFSKFVWLYPTKSTTADEAIKKLQIQQVSFGNPSRIISDRGTAFTAEAFEEFCKENNISHVRTTTGNHRGNGQVERINRVIIPILTKMSLGSPAQWYKHVSKVQQYLNNSWQRSLGRTPFEVMFGGKMRTEDDFGLKTAIEEAFITDFEEERERMGQEAVQQIRKVQEENQREYNRKHKAAYQYKINDWVAIKRTQFGVGLKIAPKLFGPYRVTKVKRNDRYDVEKVGQHEGPNKTNSSADCMKLFVPHDDSEGSDTEEESQ